MGDCQHRQRGLAMIAPDSYQITFHRETFMRKLALWHRRRRRRSPLLSIGTLQAQSGARRQRPGQTGRLAGRQPAPTRATRATRWSAGASTTSASPTISACSATSTGTLTLDPQGAEPWRQGRGDHPDQDDRRQAGPARRTCCHPTSADGKAGFDFVGRPSPTAHFSLDQSHRAAATTRRHRPAT